ncbi:Beta-xylosidase [Actinopolyspora mzabensis]|uniref:Beta-xylosidase n=1 Tax=Actinopolyspora mzabensis TaxID=995066 RepID=A0A1G8W1W4_ACTMZ|nr:glycoside hydrolase 43 family protein [Actinopolyspora mzabensis]SDJ72318.1 Beta-xylosidase [Actinopolyspora mzabensis]
MSRSDNTYGRRGILAAGAGLLAAAVPTMGARASEALGSLPSSTASTLASSGFSNPVIWQDFADVDIRRVGDTYYYSASTMHYSPGAPVLRSYDLVNWEFAGHSVPVLEFGPEYDLDGGNAYVGGIWASSLNYRPADESFYWIGQIDFAKTYVYTAPAAEGPWNRHATIDNVYYDAGLLVDDDDTLYVAYGQTDISVAQLSRDASGEVRSELVFSTPPEVGTLEGARFYRIGGNYYIFLTRPANGQYILKSSNGPFGPYEMGEVLLDLDGPVPGGGVPHQGGLVDTPDGDWYYMAFVDAYPGGRVPALAPVTWTWDGWPVVQLVDGAWGESYPLPEPAHEVEPLIGVDTFEGATLDPAWEWNHNPDNSVWWTGGGLSLLTATVTDDLYAARNTVTRRIQGPTSTATIVLEGSAMLEGDRAGLALLRDSSAWIGVDPDGGSNTVAMVDGLTMDGDWNTVSTGTRRAEAEVSGSRVWLRINADIRPDGDHRARFSYSTDGVDFEFLGPDFTMNTDWHFFLGYRFAIFNHATRALGGLVNVERFELSTP